MSTYVHQGYYNPETEKKFKNIVQYEFNKLIKDENLIFESALKDWALDTNKLFDEFYLDNDGYGKFITEADENKTYFIKNYFYNKTIVPAFLKLEESVVEASFKAIEENETFNLGFNNQLKMENTSRYLIENFIFNEFPLKTRKQLTENIIFSQKLALEESIDIQKNKIGEIYDKVEDTISSFFVGTTVGLAKSIKEALLFGVVLFYSPYQIIGSSNVKYKMLGRSGTSRVGKAIELLSPTRAIGEMLLKPYSEIGEILKKTNEIDNEDVKDFLKEIQQQSNTRETIINDCWLKNAQVLNTDEKLSFSNAMTKLANWIKTGRMRWLGNPMDMNKGMLGFLFSIDANDPSFQKSFFEFRKCVYDHLFDLIVGYAKTAMSEDITTTEILEKVKIASRRKDYNIFNKIKTDSRDIHDLMYKVGKVLLSVDEIADKLKENKQELFQDKYLDQFYTYLKQKIKQAYLDIDEAAEKQRKIIDDNKLKDDAVNNSEEKYTESWKEHSLKNVRNFDKSKKIKSIYD